MKLTAYAEKEIVGKKNIPEDLKLNFSNRWKELAA